jgi:general secretion pathway protein G
LNIALPSNGVRDFQAFYWIIRLLQDQNGAECDPMNVPTGSIAKPFRRRAVSDSQRGFTLIEILVVITIIGLIMALVGPRVLNYLTESKVKAARIQIESFSSALDLYYLDMGRYPSSTEGLSALVQPSGNVSGWNGPYLKGSGVPNDPWGHAYLYRSPGERTAYEIMSYGSDGQEGGTGPAADITGSTH